MHLADGVITNPWLIGGLSLCGIGALSASLRKLSQEDRSMGFTGTLAAFVFVAQAINVPLIGGASAHIVGAGLLALTVGTAHAIVAMSAVLVAQALLLADGGISVLGVNILNLAVLPVLAVAAVQRGLASFGLAVPSATAVLGTTLGSLAGASVLSLVLVIGAGAPAATTFPWLLGIQGVAGLVEGVLTAMAVGKLRRLAPDLMPRFPQAMHDSALPPPESRARRPSRAAVAWAAILVVVALSLVPLASDTPDALEHLVKELPGAR